MAAFIAAFQARIPDVWLGEDGTLRIVLEINAAQIEGLFLSNQIVLEDMFIQSAAFDALQRHGETFGVDQIIGTAATGALLFSGQGGIYIPIGTEVGFDPGGGQDVLYFVTIQDGTIPNPGTPAAPVATDAGAGGSPQVPAGTYEYVVTFVTAVGEGLPSLPSNAVVLSATHSINVNIPLGGPGTIRRNVYRNVNGGIFSLVTTILDNTTAAITDNVAVPGVQTPPVVDTSTSILLNAQSEDNGFEYNAVPGAITVLVSVPDGITDVTNPAAFVGGSDREDIESYRTRLLNWVRSPQTASTHDLENWAESVPGVETATAFNNTDINGNFAPGTVTVRIAGPGGIIPTGAIVNQVQSLLDDFGFANITIVVGTFNATSINITVTIFPAAGYTTAMLAPAVQKAIIDYINSIPVGGTLYISGIVDSTFGLSGVNDIQVISPTGNQVAASASKFIAGTINVQGTP